MKSFLDRFRRNASDEGNDARLNVQKETKRRRQRCETGSETACASARAEKTPKEEKPGKSNKRQRRRKAKTSHLELGDFLHRIPQQLLKPGPHDTKRKLGFDLGDLTRRIEHGQTTLSLAEVYQRIPDIFRGEIGCRIISKSASLAETRDLVRSSGAASQVPASPAHSTILSRKSCAAVNRRQAAAPPLKQRTPREGTATLRDTATPELP
jgi:hypothetical protein